MNLTNCFDDIDDCLDFYGWQKSHGHLIPLWSDNTVILDGYCLDYDLNPDKIPF